MIKRVDVQEWFVPWLATATGKQVGESDVPTQSPTMPYVVVYTIPSPEPEGPWSDPQVDLEIVYQITSVGESPVQATWMSDKVRTAVVSRDANGVFNTAMSPSGFSVLDRRLSTVGSIVKSGDQLFQIPDTYRLKVVP